MSSFEQPPLFEDSLLQDAKARGEAAAREMLAAAMREREEHPELIEAPSADIRHMYTSVQPSEQASEQQQEESEPTYTAQQVFEMAREIAATNNQRRLEQGLPPITPETIRINSQRGATDYLNGLQK